MKKINKYLKLSGSILSIALLVCAGINYYVYDKQPSNFDLLVFMSCTLVTYSNWDE